MKKLIITFCNIIFLSFFFTLSVSAESDANILLNPENPGPKTVVTLTLQSYVVNVDTASIVWKINGKTVLKGQGEKSLKVKTGSVGESSRVTVIITSANGDSATQEINITPSSLLLLYEAPKSYVPLLYPGRSLPGEGGTVRVTAIPLMSDIGRPLSPGTLSYSWYVDDNFREDLSGLGKQSADMDIDYLTSKADVRVLVRTPLGNSTSKVISIYPHNLMPLLYTYDQVLGTNFTLLVDKRFETTGDFALSLEPFYMSIQEREVPTYTWLLDDLPSTPPGGRILALHPKKNSYGSKTLSITVDGPTKVLQSGETSVEIIYDTRK